MDRFIDLTLEELYQLNHYLKSNMDRFIVNHFSAFPNRKSDLKSNMDRFIVNAAKAKLDADVFKIQYG